MTQQNFCAERDESGDLKTKMLAAHEKRLELNKSAAVRRAARSESSEKRRRIKQSQKLEDKALKDIFDPFAPVMLDIMKALYPVPAAQDPVFIMSPRNLPSNPIVNPENLRKAFPAVNKDWETGPHCAGVFWPLLRVKYERRVHPDFLGLKFLTKVV